MANSLGTETPPGPDSSLGNALMSGAPATPQAAPQGPPGAQGGQAPPPAPPTHEQTVAALRHFDAVKRELEIVLMDPALGKSSVKTKIIDGVTRLVASRFMKPADAVTELSKVPSDPLLQMKWVKGMFDQAQAAENGILDHYGASRPHLGEVADHFAASPPGNAEDHGDHMQALAANYGNRANG